MGRKKLPYERERLRLDGYLPVDDELLQQIKALPARTRFPTVMRWLKMGQAVQAISTEEISDEEKLKQFQAAMDIVESFVVD